MTRARSLPHQCILSVTRSNHGAASHQHNTTTTTRTAIPALTVLCGMLAASVGLGGATESSENEPDTTTVRTNFSPLSRFLDPPSSFVICEAAAVHHKSSSSSSSNFQVMAALEVKEELEKVRLAQLIHDLHELATIQNGKYDNNRTQSKNRVRRFITMFGKREGNVALGRKSYFLPSFFQVQSSSGEITADFSATMTMTTTTQALSPATARSLIDAIYAGGTLTPATLISLLEASKHIIEVEATCVDLTDSSNEVVVVGDLHGSIQSLHSVLQLIGDIGPNGKTVVFNGDFVDRGSQSLEVICILLLLKLAYPHHVFLLRGNHEDPLIASVYGFRDEIKGKYPAFSIDELWESITNVFTAFPLAALTKTALILHGGLPSANFSLDQLSAITPSERAQFKSPAVEATSDTARLVQNCLWSDPDPTLGNAVEANPRGCGVRFGRTVARKFLEQNELQYLIRSHEPVEDGVEVMQCGHGRSVITVFSAAAYPAGQGDNAGAIIQLHPSGGFQTLDFQPVKDHANDRIVHSDHHHITSEQAVRSLIVSNKVGLEKSFREKQDKKGQVSIDVWAKVMADQLELPEMPWKSLQPTLAPTTEKGSNSIDWQAFLKSHSSKFNESGACPSEIQNLHSNHKMLWTVFKFLDVDGDGTVELKEFKRGVELLNKRLPKERQLMDPVSLFQMLDEDGNGVIDINEFQKIFAMI